MSKNIVLIFIYSLLLMSIGCKSSSTVQEPIFQQNRKEKEQLDLQYIKECISQDNLISDLITWKPSGENSNPFCFAYKDKLVYFRLSNEKTYNTLHSIDYYHNSFQKMIFLDESSTIKLTETTQIKVWMSRDQCSTYFGIINENNLLIWILTKENTVYTFSSEL